jgi:hypothetical protein
MAVLADREWGPDAADGKGIAVADMRLQRELWRILLRWKTISTSILGWIKVDLRHPQLDFAPGKSARNKGFYCH